MFSPKIYLNKLKAIGNPNNRKISLNVLKLKLGLVFTFFTRFQRDKSNKIVKIKEDVLFRHKTC